MREGFPAPARLNGRMSKFPIAADGHTSFPGKLFLILASCALTFLVTPIRGQDAGNAPPPPTGTDGPAMNTGSAAPPPPGSDVSGPNNGATAPDAAAGAADDSASFQTFYDALGSQGTWIQSSDYGYVWQPQVNDPDWAPYTAGHWVYSDDGWTWVSDESFGWATYHYGRWANIDGTGWVWVPGYTWAPAWVSWRYGDGYAGWAPLPPDSFVGFDYSDGSDFGDGYHIGADSDAFYGIGAGLYIFLPVNCLGYRHYHGYYRNRGDNFGLINRTANVTNINVARNGATAAAFGRVTTGGPSLAQVNAASQTPVPRVNLVRSNERGGGGTLSGNSLALYAPLVSSGTTGPPARVTGSLGQARLNRGTDILRPITVNSRFTPAPATDAQVQQARDAQAHAPASAKVVTDSTPVRPGLQAPLTSLKPIPGQMAPSRAFNQPATAISPAERFPSTPPAVPTMRPSPQTSEGEAAPSHIYSPGTVYPQGSPIYEPRPTVPGTVYQQETPIYQPRTSSSGAVYPQGASVYQPHPSATGTANPPGSPAFQPRAPAPSASAGSESRSYARPAPSAPSATATPQSAGGNSAGSAGFPSGAGGGNAPAGGASQHH